MRGKALAALQFVLTDDGSQIDSPAEGRKSHATIRSAGTFLLRRRASMSCSGRSGLKLMVGAFAMAMFGAQLHAQQPAIGKPTDLPNPYRLVEGWPTLPQSMNGGRWGEVIRVHVAGDGTIWVFHRCFNTVPPGHATCINRGEANPPILQFDASGKLLKSFGAGMFAYPHAFTIDGDGNLWVSDVNDQETVLGMSTRNKDGVMLGQEVLKLSPDGKVLMMLGKMGVAGNGPDTFDRPTGVAIAPNGDIFVTDGHQPNTFGNARVMKFNKDGQFIKAWGRLGPAPGDFSEPHDIHIGGSQQRVYVADRKNSRIQVFDQDGKFILEWKQFGKPNSVFVGKDDTIYVGASFRNPGANKLDELRGIIIGDARNGSLKAFILDPSDLNQVEWGTSASGIAADDEGSVFAADVGTHNLRKYAKVK
jgi:DNA-binding beta-propeller fold protein YncE